MSTLLTPRPKLPRPHSRYDSQRGRRPNPRRGLRAQARSPRPPRRAASRWQAPRPLVAAAAWQDAA
jgi:hypothetical protein